MTPEKEIGTKFEIWLELVFKQLKLNNVMRNVEYRVNGAHRQADLVYQVIHEDKKNKKTELKLILVEAKYSSNGNISYQLRQNKEKRSMMIENINNLVDEVDERRMFIGADYAVLATNKGFDYKIKENSKNRRIKLLDSNNFSKIYSQDLNLNGDFQKSIKSIQLKRYNINPNIIYL